jgi:outer membrane cobalamin receptor
MKRKLILIPLIFSYVALFAQNKEKNKDSIAETLVPVIITNIADFAHEETAPIAVSTIKAQELSLKAGNETLPSLLLSVPSVYATKQGGGYGDDRINIRGFNQRYIAVLINGVPVNDMESGWVYWSNWMNLTDIASSIQVQRGLSAVKLAVPAVGGSVQIYTKSADKSPSGLIQYQYGSEGFHKVQAGYNTGIMDNGLSTSVLLGYYKGDGYVDQTQGEGYNYFINLDYLPNEKHRFMFTLLGGPQWHNQHNNASELRDYLTYGGTTDTPNIKYNSEWGYLNGKEYTWSRNYFHKPIAILNWDYKINSSLKLTSAFYGAWGRGGGSGPIGAINYQYPNSDIFLDENGQVRFDDIYTWNAGGNVPDFGPDRTPSTNGLYLNNISNGLTRYAFMNNHSWYGTVINLYKEISPALKLNIGIDGRLTKGRNTLAVNDVLGADGYYDNSDVNNPDRIIYPDQFVDIKPDWNPFKSIADLEKIVFYNGSNIRWIGTYGQLNYKKDNLSGFLQGGVSNQSFQRVDFFNYTPGNQYSDWVSVWGGNIKTGLNFSLGNTNFYANGGYFSKQPLFKAVFPNWNSNEPTSDLKNEKITSVEVGYKHQGEHVQLGVGVYQTHWKDRFEMAHDFINNQPVSGRMYGIEEVHRGIEAEVLLKWNALKLKSMVSVGDWKYKNDVKNVELYNFQQQLVAVKDYYLKDVKVGDAPQFTAAFSVYYKPAKKWNLFAEQIFVDKLYAKINADSFSNPNHQGSLELPAYSIVNAGISYQTKIKDLGRVYVSLTGKNLMDKVYISESHTNIFPDQQSLTWKGVDTKNRVFFGWGRTIDLSLKFKF